MNRVSIQSRETTEVSAVMKKFPIALQLYSVRDFAEKDMRGTLQKVKALGYDGVEFAGLYGYAPEDVKAMCEEIGLVPISAHVPIDDLLKPGTVAAYKTIGCRFIAVPWLGEERRPGHEKYAQTLKDIVAIAEEVNRQGMTLLYHNHDFEFVKVDGAYALDIMYENIPADLLQTELDTCWVRVGGADPSAYVKKYSGSAPVVHLKDYVGEKSEHMYELIGVDSTAKEEETAKFELRPVGDGVQDFPSIIAACEQAGTEWLVVEQDTPSGGLSSLACAERSRNYLKTIGQ